MSAAGSVPPADAAVIAPRAGLLGAARAPVMPVAPAPIVTVTPVSLVAVAPMIAAVALVVAIVAAIGLSRRRCGGECHRRQAGQGKKCEFHGRNPSVWSPRPHTGERSRRFLERTLNR